MAAPLTNPQRLFIAISPPESVRAAVAALSTPLRDVRWTPLEQLHVTLRFIGDTEPGPRDQLMERISTVHVEPFPLAVEGAGVFPAKGIPRVLWVGVGSGHPRLYQLRQRIDDAVLAEGLPVDLGTFHPHLTVGRCSQKANAGPSAWARSHRAFTGPLFLVESFELCASELHPHGVQHHLLKRFPLAV